MALIPRRLVFRVLSQVLHGQSRAIGGRTAERSGDRRGPGAGEHAAEKDPKRSRKADDLRIQAPRANPWVWEIPHYQGPGLDAVLLGWLSVLALGHNEAKRGDRADCRSWRHG